MECHLLEQLVLKSWPIFYFTSSRLTEARPAYQKKHQMLGLGRPYSILGKILASFILKYQARPRQSPAAPRDRSTLPPRARLFGLSRRCPCWVTRGGAFRLQRISVAAMPPITTKSLQRRDWSQRANSGSRRNCVKLHSIASLTSRNLHLPLKLMLGRGCPRLADSCASFQATAASLLSYRSAERSDNNKSAAATPGDEAFMRPLIAA
jgi:hypothetical protein